MSIEVNSRKVEWIENETVKELLKRMKYSFPLIVVKINDEIISRSNFSEVYIPNNSKVSVIHMISGG